MSRHLTDSEDDQERLLNQRSYLKHKHGLLVDKWDEFGSIGAIEDELYQVIINTHAAIEEATTHIIINYVIDDGFSDSAYNYVYSNMSQHHREKLLSECGILSNKTKGEMSYFRSLRNKVAHEPFARLDWNQDDIGEKLEDGITALDKLTEGATDAGLISEIKQRDGKRI